MDTDTNAYVVVFADLQIRCFCACVWINFDCCNLLTHVVMIINKISLI